MSGIIIKTFFCALSVIRSLVLTSLTLRENQHQVRSSSQGAGQLIAQSVPDCLHHLGDRDGETDLPNSQNLLAFPPIQAQEFESFPPPSINVGCFRYLMISEKLCRPLFILNAGLLNSPSFAEPT